MGVAIAPYTPEHAPAVRAFNERLARAGIAYRFPDRIDRVSETSPLVPRAFLALETGQHVRGGYLLKEQDCWVNGRLARVGYLHLPLSEGLIDRRYSMLAVQLIAHALKRQPLLFGLGIGGADETFARVIAALGWRLSAVPFFFKVLRPFRVARRLAAVRRTPVRRVLCDVAAWSGAAAVGNRLSQIRWNGVRAAEDRELRPADSLEAAGDNLWERHRGEYRFVACRNGASLTQLYGPGSRPYLRWVSRADGRDQAWAVALDTQMRDHKYFGDLRVATIVDCFGDPAAAPSLMAGVSAALAARGADLIVSNQSSATWASSLERAGFASHASNYFFAASPGLIAAIGSDAGDITRVHLTRGDGDGPINL
jgi:hypothetical protein